MSRIQVELINRRLLSGFLLGSLVFVPTVALAKYSPVDPNPPRESSRAGGSRGCPGGEKAPLTVLLAPHTFVGKTASVRPTLAWFASKPEETDVHIYKLVSNGKLETVAIEKPQTRAGINKFKLPQGKTLTPGKQYLWQVSVKCTDGSYSMQKAEFEVVQKPQALEAQLSNVTNSSQRASIYAENELWYEALEETPKISRQGQSGKVNSDLIEELILVYKNELKNEVAPDKRQDIEKQIRNLQVVLGKNISLEK
ncbi:DUF928 domain-containing protein [Calothrix sp. CCY 0018]|uniref:DUF928 domain-containing protein n=1 Tax=Calothrix sp. CCY 0018 TaxID=3103864 RepID=UPI0039C5DFD0